MQIQRIHSLNSESFSFIFMYRPMVNKKKKIGSLLCWFKRQENSLGNIFQVKVHRPRYCPLLPFRRIVHLTTILQLTSNIYSLESYFYRNNRFTCMFLSAEVTPSSELGNERLHVYVSVKGRTVNFPRARSQSRELVTSKLIKRISKDKPRTPTYS